MIRAALAGGTILALSGAVLVGAFATASGSPTSAPGTIPGPAASDIPPLYLQLYVAAGQQERVDWAILAAIGKVETDHGRLDAPGVTSGVNSAGCCAGPMQFSITPRPSTWDMFGAGGNVYDPAAAIPAAARYLRASGAPRDYHAAILSYNHAEWYYRKVIAQADLYRAGTTTTLPVDPPGDGILELPQNGAWLAPLPGMPGRQCDARIIPNLLTLIAHYHLQIGDCYAPTGHEADGEHPLGLAADITPGPGGSWDLLDQLARDVGWIRSCGWSGVRPVCPLKPWLRFVGWDGYPGHGRGSHLHLSWDHGPGRPATTVRVFATN